MPEIDDFWDDFGSLTLIRRGRVGGGVRRELVSAGRSPGELVFLPAAGGIFFGFWLLAVEILQ